MADGAGERRPRVGLPIRSRKREVENPDINGLGANVADAEGGDGRGQFQPGQPARDRRSGPSRGGADWRPPRRRCEADRARPDYTRRKAKGQTITLADQTASPAGGGRGGRRKTRSGARSGKCF